MKHSLYGMLILLSIHTQAQWQELAHFEETIVFYASAKENKILALPKFNAEHFISYDDGTSFSEFEIPIIVESELNGGICMLDTATIFATKIGAGAYLKSTDGGVSWSEHYIPDESSSLTGVYFFDQENGVFSTAHKMYRTDDGGGSFSSISIPTSPLGRVNQIQSFDFVNHTTGIIGCTNYNEADSMWENTIYHTMDGGINWHLAYYHTSKQNTPADHRDLHQVQMIDNNIGYAMGEGGIFVKTIDGGMNWNNVVTVFSHQILKFRFLSENFGIAISGIALIKTEDGGLTWSTETLDSDNPYTRALNLTAANDSTILITAVPSTFTPDSYIYKYVASPSSLSIDTKDLLSSFIVYPNPAKDAIHLQYDPMIRVKHIALYDIQGRMIRDFGTSDKSLNVSGISSGVYLLNIQTDKGSKAKQIVIE